MSGNADDRKHDQARLGPLRRAHPRPWKFWVAWDNSIVARHPAMTSRETIQLGTAQEVEDAITAWEAAHLGRPPAGDP
jgi:hypothetical protein